MPEGFTDGNSMRRYILGTMGKEIGFVQAGGWPVGASASAPGRLRGWIVWQSQGLIAVLALSVLVATGCKSEATRDCPDPVAQSKEYMTETEKKLARLKTGFDPNCK